MLAALLVMTVSMTLLFVAILLMAMRNEILRRRVRSLELAAAAA
jgi:heme exporter protein C